MDTQLLFNAIKTKRPGISDNTINIHINNLSRVLNLLNTD
jgi:hypothetical protein